MNTKELINFSLRYIILLGLALSSLGFIYAIFTPLTVYPVFFILKLLYGAVLLENNLILFKGQLAQIIPSCVAGAAYFLLLALNLVTPMTPSKRVKSILILFLIFLGLNILRILIFAALLVAGFQYFDIAHQATWYLGSSLLVILIWFAHVKILNIKAVPVYSDIKRILNGRSI